MLQFIYYRIEKANLHQIQSRNVVPVTDMGETEVEQPQQKR